MSYLTFISHSSEDTWIAKKLSLDCGSAGAKTFLDEAQIQNGRLHRINVTDKEGEFSLDDARPEKIQPLINLGHGEVVKKESLDIVNTRFLNGTHAPLFTPLHALATS